MAHIGLPRAYAASFAVALCEGPISGVGRIWANGETLSHDAAVMRLHTGREDQAPDPLIEAVEGSAPAYRGLAYMVFEDLPLDGFGAAADAVNYIPILRNVMYCLSAGSAAYKVLLKGLKDGISLPCNNAGRKPRHLYILPGGIAEIFSANLLKNLI